MSGAASSQGPRRLALAAGLILTGILLAPLVGMVAVEAFVRRACEVRVVAGGLATGRLQWSVREQTCGTYAPYYDVVLGAQGETLSTALTSRGAPIPLDVTRLDDRHAVVRLDRPRAKTGETSVTIALRRTGSPAERIDLDADATR